MYAAQGARPEKNHAGIDGYQTEPVTSGFMELTGQQETGKQIWNQSVTEL